METVIGFFETRIIIALIVACVAGLLRGLAGTGSAIFMALTLAMIFGGQNAAIIVVLVELAAALPSISKMIPKAERDFLVPATLASFIFVPAGIWVLFNFPIDAVTRALAIIAFIYIALMKAGRRYRGPKSTAMTAFAGGLSGAMMGATGVGSPPILLYTISGPNRADIYLANIVIHRVLVMGLALVAWALLGLVTVQHVAIAAVMIPVFAVGMIVGARLFRHQNRWLTRRLVLAIIAGAAIYVLFG